MADPKPPSGGSDRARRINSLHNKVNGMVQEQDKKAMQISSEVSSLTKEQQRLMQQLDIEKSEFTNETANAYNGVVKSLGKTIQNLSVGVASITKDTAKATAGAIGQYGKAIGEDISINKQNTMVMAMSRATPLFGYFAAKFMETDVFQQSAKKIKDQVSGTLSKAGESLANVFKKKEAESAPVPPKLQEGGFIKKGGMIEVHAAEVVTPVDKILDRIDPAGGKKLLIIQKKMLSSINELKAAQIGSADRLSIAWQKTLVENPALKSMLTFSQLMKTSVTAPFKILFSARGGYAGDVKKATRTSNIYQQQVNLLALIYAKGMVFLRNIDKYTKVTAEALVGEEVSPVSTQSYTLFGKIKEFMTTRKISAKSAFDTFSESLGLDKSALKEAGITSFSDLLSPGAILRNMGFTKANIFGKMREGPAAPITDEQARRAKEIKDIAMGRASSIYETGAGAVSGAGAWAKGKGEEAWGTAKTWKGRMVDELSRIRKSEEDREDREGPHSPSMAQNIASTTITAIKGNKLSRALAKQIGKIRNSIFKTAKLSKKAYIDNYRSERDKQRKLAEIRKHTRDTATTAKRNRKDARGWIPMIVGFFSNLLGRMGRIGRLIKTISVFFLGPFMRMFKLMGKGLAGVGRLFGKGAGKTIIGGSGKIGKALGGARGALQGGGVRGLARFATGAGGKVLGAAAGTAGGLVVGGGMALWDMAQAIMNGDAKGFVGNFIVRGLAGFIGGTDTGAKGAMTGAMKGSALGAAIGSLIPIPGVGTLIGGALGAMAGGILGFVGGAKLSEGIKNSMSGIADIAKAIWKIAIFPFQLVSQVIKSIYVVLKFAAKKIWNWIDEKLSGPGWIGTIWEKFKNFAGMIGGFISGIFKNLLGMFSGDKLKEMLYQFLFPIPRLVAALKNIGNVVDGWLSGLPIIGRAYKWAKRSVKSIQSGDMSKSLERALEGKPQLVTDAQRDKLSSAEIAKLYADEEAAKQKAEEDRMNRQTNKLNETSDKNTDSRNKTTVVTTNNVVTSNTSTNVGGGMSPFPSGPPSYSTGSEALAASLAAGNT